MFHGQVEGKRLTKTGWLRRQRKLAMTALRRYPIEFDRVDLVSAATNIIYRARGSDGRLYALRLVGSDWRTEDNLRAEVAWLRALAVDTEIPVPGVVDTIEGEPYVRLRDGHSQKERRALLMTWLPGMLLAKRLNAQNIWKLGELFATLHVHAMAWAKPADFPGVAFTSFLGRGEPNLLFDEIHSRILSPETMEVLHATRDRVRRAYTAMGKDDLCVIHCDLWHENVKLYRGVLAPIDFEDTILGYREHDLAMGLLDLAEEVPIDVYRAYLEKFVAGYESVTSYPRGDILAFQLGRILWQLNWIARFQPGHLVEAAASKAVILARALSTGRLVRL
jgi:Ser/Thr protein kinase RdoA (MazF antagonist)